MREEDIRILQRDIEIPDVVLKKADLAFKRIQEESREQERISLYRRAKNRKIRIAMAAAAAVMGMVTACTAAYLHWSRGMEAEFHATEEQKRYLEEIKIASPAEKERGVTYEGVTVTPIQSIVDSQFAFLAFKIEGYELEEGKEPCFENIGITVDGRDDISWNAGFYDGLTVDEYGRAVCEDGTLVQDLPEGVTAERFVREDGSMELDIEMLPYREDGFFIDAPVHVVLENLGTVYKAEFVPDLEGKWELDMKLSGSDKMRHMDVGKEIGDSGAVVSYAEISPISLQVTYEFEAQAIELEAVGANREPVTVSDYKEPPAVTGVRLKDGTMLMGICFGGMTKWVDLEKGIYRETFALKRVIDAEQVDGLLFFKPDEEGENVLGEENLYVVPVE